METATVRNMVTVGSSEFKKAFGAIKPRKTSGEFYGWVGFKWDGIVFSVSCMFGVVRVKYTFQDVVCSGEEFAFAVEWGKVESIVSNSSGDVSIELLDSGNVLFSNNSGSVELRRFDLNELVVINEDIIGSNTIVLETDGLLSACRTLLPLALDSKSVNHGRPYLDCVYVDLNDNNGMVCAYATNSRVMGKFKIAEYSRTLIGHCDGIKIPRSVSSILKTYKPTVVDELTTIRWNSERLIINCGSLVISSIDEKLFSSIYPNVENIFKYGEYWIDIPADELKSTTAIGKSICKRGDESTMAFKVNAEFNNESLRISIGDYGCDIAIVNYYLPGNTIGKWGLDPILLDTLLKGFSKRDSIIRIHVSDHGSPIMFDVLGTFSGIQAPILMEQAEQAQAEQAEQA